VNLSKPLAVLAKKSPRNPEAAKDSRATSASEDDITTEVSYDVVALVKRKLLFSKRPMPIVGQASTVA
jgi:chromosome transmission fidelity protein 8